MNAVSPSAALPSHRLSIVVPLYNEEDNVAPLLQGVHEALAGYGHPWELILVDDGSSDRTAERAAGAAREYGLHVRLIELTRNFKQTAAMQAGVDAARGEVIVTMDGDLQNDPVDIPRLVARLLNEDLDLVAGWRRDRQDPLLRRKLPSRIANRLIARLTGVRLKDYGCSLKAFRASVIKNVRLYGEMHRFIPAWLATVTTPRRIAQEPVCHHARATGVSKYGLSRTFRVVLDLVAVYFFMRFRARPGHFFGGIGLALTGVSALALAWLFWVKFGLGENIGSRPLFLAGIGGMIAGLHFITTGVLAEIMARIYFESGTARLYLARPERALADNEGWRRPP
jgi:glycosyltransferase involved in cell wall biosynthesis